MPREYSARQLGRNRHEQPVQSVQETTFSQDSVEYASNRPELGSFLPAPESILNQVRGPTETGELSVFLQTGYEHVQRVCAV